MKSSSILGTYAAPSGALFGTISLALQPLRAPRAIVVRLAHCSGRLASRCSGATLVPVDQMVVLQS
jgi:hypothetical protein